MEAQQTIRITIEAVVKAPIALVWKRWTTPEDIVQWNTASADWHTVRAANDVRVGGTFSSRMEAKDGSMGFDFWGVYDSVVEPTYLASTLGDGRKLEVTFSVNGSETKIVESFDAEHENSVELQRGGWQSILDNFKRYAEK